MAGWYLKYLPLYKHWNGPSINFLLLNFCFYPRFVFVDFNASEDNSVEAVGYEDDFESDDECNDDEGKMLKNCSTENIFCS